MHVFVSTLFQTPHYLHFVLLLLSSMEKKEDIQLHWYPIDKQFLLVVSIDDLMDYLSSSKSKFVAEVISEALSFAKSNGGNWTFYRCCCCNEKFVDPDLHFEHVKRTHLEDSLLFLEGVSPFQHPILPERISSEWESMILSGTWKPIDTLAALAMFQEQLDLQRPEFPFNDWSVGVLTRQFNLESHLREGSEYILRRGWPLIDDLERESVLEVVRNLLLVLFFDGTITKAHVDYVIRYSLKELEPFFPGLETWLQCLNQMHMCVCFLGASQLQKVVNILQKVSHFPARSISDEVNKKHNALSNSTLGFSSKEKISLNGNSLCIFLDEHSLGGESGSGNVNYVGDCGDSEYIYDSLSRWSFARPSSEEQLKLWARLREKKNDQGKDLILILEKKYDILQHVLGNKQDRLTYNQLLQLIWLKYRIELRARFRHREYVSQSFETILEKTKRNKGVDSHLIRPASNILKEARSGTLEKSLTGLGTTFFDFEHLDDRCLTLRTEADIDIEEAFKRDCENNDLELIRIDARVVRALAETHKLELMINPFAFVDYRVVLLPLVKSYVQTNMGQPADDVCKV